jgi:hypothetical protein
MSLANRPIVAIGPEACGWGSWDWVGLDLAAELSKYYQTVIYAGPDVPACDAAIVVKHALAHDVIADLSRRAGVCYCPVDYYGSARDIDADAPMLRKCTSVVVHCERLRRYFEPYALVEYIDHHVKFAAPPRESYRPDGFIVWVGVRSNLGPLVDWINRHPPPGELRVLTNPEDPTRAIRAADFGFRRDLPVEIAAWSPERQRQWTLEARAAIDIKGDDFRSRHKPPAKAIDFLASGVPLALNPDSSPAEHLERLGFAVASPSDADRWFSRDYWEECSRFGSAIGELLTRERIGRRFKRILDAVIARRRPG